MSVICIMNLISIQFIALNQLFKCSTVFMNSILLSTNIHFLNPLPKFKTCRPPIRKTILFLYSLVFVKALCFCNLLCTLVLQFLHCISTQTSHNNTVKVTWCFSDRESWIDYIFITNLMHWLLFIHKILFSSTCFEPQVLIFRRIQVYTCSIWYCHSLREFVVACQYAAWVRTEFSLKLCTDRPPGTLIESDSTIVP